MKRKSRTVECMFVVGLFLTTICAIFQGNTDMAAGTLGIGMLLASFYILFGGDND